MGFALAFMDLTVPVVRPAVCSDGFAFSTSARDDGTRPTAAAISASAFCGGCLLWFCWDVTGFGFASVFLVFGLTWMNWNDRSI